MMKMKTKLKKGGLQNPFLELNFRYLLREMPPRKLEIEIEIGGLQNPSTLFFSFLLILFTLTLSPDLELGVPSSNESPPFSPRSMASSDSDDGQREEEAGTKPAPAQLTLGPMWQRLISAAERGRRHEQTQLTPSLALAYGTAALAGSACMFTGVTLYRGVRRERRGDERAVDATARLAATPVAARALATASAATIAVAGVAILAMRACGLRTTQDVANAGRAIVTGEPKA